MHSRSRYRRRKFVERIGWVHDCLMSLADVAHRRPLQTNYMDDNSAWPMRVMDSKARDWGKGSMDEGVARDEGLLRMD